MHSHSGYPYLGKSATQLLINALNDLTAAQWPESDLLGSSTLNIGKIEGGAGYNILAAEASALCSLRVAADLPGIKRQIADIVARHSDVELRVCALAVSESSKKLAAVGRRLAGGSGLC